jgi:HAMP domain-containing protein
MEQFFHVLIAVCGFLVVVRVLTFALRVRLREHRPILTKPVDDPPTAVSAWVAAPQPFQRREENRKDQHTPERTTPFLWRCAGVLGGFCPRSLMGRMIVAFSAIVATFGLLTAATIHFMLLPSLRTHAGARASTTAAIMGDSVSGFLSKKDISGLRAFLRSYAEQAGAAYAMVEDDSGRILAHSLPVLADETQQELANGLLQRDGARLVMIGGRAVHEVAVSAAGGIPRTVRLGIWRDDLEAESARILARFLTTILLIVGLGISLVVYLAWKLCRPIDRLAKAAQLISDGDLLAPSLDVDDPTEVGELSRSLERLRSSVHAAISRLSLER